MDRTLIEASEDLYATPWRTFVQVTLPQLAAGHRGGLRCSPSRSASTISSSRSSPRAGTRRCPIYLFASIRRGVSPEVNAIATVLLAVTILAMVTAGLVYRRGQRRAGVGIVQQGDAAVAGVALTTTAQPADGAS